MMDKYIQNMSYFLIKILQLKCACTAFMSFAFIAVGYFVGSCAVTLIVSRRVCVCVSVSATLMQNISETKRFGGSYPIGSL